MNINTDELQKSIEEVSPLHRCLTQYAKERARAIEIAAIKFMAAHELTLIEFYKLYEIETTQKINGNTLTYDIHIVERR